PFKRECPALTVLGRVRAKANDASLPVHVCPRQGGHFTLAPARQIRKAREVPQVGRKLCTHRLKLSALKEPLPGVALGQKRDRGHGGEALLSHGQVECPPN